MLKLNVGLSRKIGEVNYGSRGASVNLELEVDSGVVREPDRLHEQLRYLFRMAKQSVDEQLGGGQQPAESQRNGKGHRIGNGTTASQKQLDYARQLAGQIQGLGARRLETLASKMFGKPLAGLSSLDASALIDTLKAIKAGRLDVDAALDETSARP